MYRCYDCKAVFGAPEEEDIGVEPYEFWGERGYRRMVKYVCPACGRDDINPYDEEAETEIDDEE